jgi:hypothetical protein
VVPQVRDAGGLGHPGELQVAAALAEVLEQAAATAEQDRRQVQADLVKQVRAQQLLGNVGAMRENILPPQRLPELGPARRSGRR